MRMHKLVKRMVVQHDGYHTLYLLLKKHFEADGKVKWTIATDHRGKPLISHLA